MVAACEKLTPCSLPFNSSLFSYAGAHKTMDNSREEEICKSFLNISPKTSVLLVLLLVPVSIVLHMIISSCFILIVCLAAAVCVGLSTVEWLGLSTGADDLSHSAHRNRLGSFLLSMHADCSCRYVSSTEELATKSWKCGIFQLLLQLSCLFPALRRTLLSDLDKDLYSKDDGGWTEITERHRASFSGMDSANTGAAHALKKGANNADYYGKDVEAQSSGSHFPYSGSGVGGTPEFEDSIFSCAGERVCNILHDATKHASDDPIDEQVIEDACILMATNISDSASAYPNEDEYTVDKHQIHPIEGYRQCEKLLKQGSDAANLKSGLSICRMSDDLDKFEITDAELQKSASDYYTLEGDVLWSRAETKKHSKDGAQGSDTCDLCKQVGELSVSVQKLSNFSSERWSETNQHTCIPVNRSSFCCVNAMIAQEETWWADSERSSAEKMSEDMVIDKELRAIANRSGNKGEESNYMSIAGSFRDYIGSFRELDMIWPDEEFTERKEDGYFIGCCDDHAKPCVLHSKSRSKVLQNDPLLSKATLTREQEMMDVLWQEYNEDRKQKQGNNLNKRTKESSRWQRLKAPLESSGISEVLDAGNGTECLNVHQSSCMMNPNNPMAGCTSYSKGLYTHSPRFRCDKPCCRKMRGDSRRRQFIGFCRLFRELGLKQCIQSSKVNR
ncbi:hypothetical protein KP509_13G022400 [Ceratopteris richardii]|uniref:Uncharacterized protein n=1 Tax=Ceratopteris richardii TaxID=49495 RepID=A0A8T2THG3_CERRI|nr:hypothetical protein KP509_13G022400 [Ceratopteris richardii]